MRWRGLFLIFGLFISPGAAGAETLAVRAGSTQFTLDPATLKIDATTEKGAVIAVMPALHAPEKTTPARDDKGWHWRDGEGRNIRIDVENEALHLVITAPADAKLSWPMPPVAGGAWLIPDGEGIDFGADDPAWLSAYAKEHCLGGTTNLSFPAWSYLTSDRTVTYALGDGLQSRLCLHTDGSLQARLSHSFDEGASTLDLLFAIGPADPLAPALFYRHLMKARGQFVSLADKAVPDLPRLYGAPQAYVWGDGRDLGFLDDLKALGITRIVLSYDQPPHPPKHAVGPAYLKKAYADGYLAGPYEAFDNAQPEATADSPASIWSPDLYPSGCVIKADGTVMAGFANRGCQMSSAAVAAHPQAISPASRYADHIKDGASEVFVDVDAFGEFNHDYSPAHPMTMMQDRANRLARLGLGITTYHLLIGSENVTAWSSGVAHFSHGTVTTHVASLWPIQADKKRFGGYWPDDRPPLFFAPLTLTPTETRLMFGDADRLPLFEAAFHDSVIASDRWELGLMKIPALQRARFARALLYGTPTMWNLDRQELGRAGIWLKAAQDDFRIAHGWEAPVALTGFAWLSDDHLVQQTTYADGRSLTANFSPIPWQGLGSDCVRVQHPGQKAMDLCPPPDPKPLPVKPYE